MTSLVDCHFFADEQAEQPDRAPATRQHSPLAELSPRSRAQSADPGARAEVAGPSTDADVGLYTIQRYLRQQGHERKDFLKYNATQSRLDSVNLSAETLLTALKAAYDANHPLLVTLGVSAYERSELIDRLAGIVNRRQFGAKIKSAVQSAHNDPDQLIENLLAYARK